MIYTVSGLQNDHPVREMLFNLLPSEKPERVDVVPEKADALGVSVTSTGLEWLVRVCCRRDGQEQCTERRVPVPADGDARYRALNHGVKLAVYDALVPFLNEPPEWGALTGVRPAKFARVLMDQGCTPAQTANIMTEQYHVSAARRALAIRSAGVAQDIKSKLAPRDIGLYLGIPFCPSRCSYCSFVSHSIEKTAKLVPPYLDTLCGEIAHAGGLVRQADLHVSSAYIGGGTPTTLNPEQLERLLTQVEQCFDLSSCAEFTVEAGRPDTITADKLAVLANHGVGRISINPQSMNEAVLERIGRRHSPQQVLDVYALARQYPFRTINMDVIAGLDGDTPERFGQTMRTLISLDPENITVHTLAIKRGADRNNRHANDGKHEAVRRMLDIAADLLTKAGYVPYYLYRQKFMAGGFENVGWCKIGHECMYNVCMMEELQTILSLGAGGMTKLLTDGQRKIRRISNPKYPYEYNDALEAIKAGKNALLDWARELPGD